MSLYERFAKQNEEDFRRGFVRPLLNKLGFFLVTDYHGTREFGKDFVFGELHRFGIMKYLAAQVKHEEKISLGHVSGLVDDVKQAFANSFTLPETHEKMYISTFYIFNSGGITDQAKTNFRAQLGSPPYRGNVHTLCDERLDWLNRWGALQNDQYIRKRLSGLRNQLVVNIEHWDDIKRHIEENDSLVEVNASILTGLELFLSEPTLLDICQRDLYNIRNMAIGIDMINSRFFMKIVGREANKESLIMKINSVRKLAVKVIDDIDRVLSGLKPMIEDGVVLFSEGTK